MMRTLALVCAVVVGACSWGNTSGTPQQTDAPVNTMPVCGDGICASSEVGHCMQDCGGMSNPVCGNGLCENGETPTNCAQDCMAASSCGNGVCDTSMGESNANCPQDCPNMGGLNCQDPPTIIGCLICINTMVCIPPGTLAACTACVGTGSGCMGGMPNGTCDPGENHTNCPFDCP